uniref:Uncharacterized protein n=1 Tax=Anopheles atroparvus TaxID=41427 RepID=A0AAG5D502_ANOAO
MDSVTPTMNFLATKGKKVIVECGGHVFSVPLEDVRDLPLSDHPTRRSYYALDRSTMEETSELKPKSDEPYNFETTVKRAPSESLSEMSDSDAESLSLKEPVPSVVPSSSPSQVLAKLKDEVTRLIDESIKKIEQDWAEKTMVEKDDPEKVKAAQPEEEETAKLKMSEDTHMPLHPDGDRGQPNYREQNLQILHSKSFVECKRLTRMKLLDEIHALVARLKDMETLD